MGMEVWGRMDTCVCMAESLCCVPDSITYFYFFSFYVVLHWVFIVVCGTSLVVNHGLYRVCVFTDYSAQTSVFAVCRLGALWHVGF